MNNRIYDANVYEKTLNALKMNLFHCPFCFSNNLTDKDDNFVIFFDYKCLDCNSIFDKGKALSKSSVRDKKIDRVLKK